MGTVRTAITATGATATADHVEPTQAVATIKGANGNDANGHNGSGANGHTGNGLNHSEPFPVVSTNKDANGNGTNGHNGANGHNGNGLNGSNRHRVEAILAGVAETGDPKRRLQWN